MFAGPAVGGFLFALVGLPGLVSIELVSFLVATFVVAAMTIPQPSAPEGEAEEPVSLLADSVFGIKWIVAHKPLFKFLLIATVANFFISIGTVLMPPYGLSFLSESSYGITNGLFGAGMIAGGLVFGVLSNRFTNVQQFLLSAIVMGAVYIGYGFSRDPYSLGAMNLLFATMMTICNAAIMTVWQVKVPENLQGRVLSTMRLVADITMPLSFVLAGPLTDRIVPGIYERTHAASIWGDSATGEMGAVFSVMGVILLVGFVLASTIRDVRRVEDLPV